MVSFVRICRSIQKFVGHKPQFAAQCRLYSSMEAATQNPVQSEILADACNRSKSEAYYDPGTPPKTNSGTSYSRTSYTVGCRLLPQPKSQCLRMSPFQTAQRSYTSATGNYANTILDDAVDRRSGAGDDDVSITTTSACFVQPGIPIPNTWLALSNMDRLMPSVYERSFFVYKSTKARSFHDVVASLKQTLSRVLTPFYPLAGRMKNADEMGVYQLHCNGLGVEFIEAYADAYLDELEYHELNPSLGRKLAPSNVINSNHSEMSPLCIQITRFRCGGIIVGCSFHHQVADVYSGHLFLKAWSQVMRGQPMNSVPYHDRSLLNAKQPPQPFVDHEVEYSMKPKDEERMARPTRSTEEASIVSKTFHFSSPILQSLKKRANGEGQRRSFTSTEVTTAYLWRLVTRARGIAEDERIKMFISVDGRTRLQDPALPDGYFGNMIALASSHCRTADLLNQPLSFGADLVNKSKSRTASSDYFRSLIDWIEFNKPHAVVPNLNIFTDPVMIASSCIRLPMYEIDFGWGRPLFAGFSAMPEGVANFVILLPSPLGYGNLSASLHLRADHMEKLENDPEFEMVAAGNA